MMLHSVSRDQNRSTLVVGRKSIPSPMERLSVQSKIEVAEMCLHQDGLPLLTYDVRKAGHAPPVSELFHEAIEMLLDGEPAREFHYTSL
jgi:hypothetical protein